MGFFIITDDNIFSLASQPMETSEPTSKRLQNKMESLQNLVESSQIKNQGASIYQKYSRFIEKKAILQKLLLVPAEALPVLLLAHTSLTCALSCSW